MLDCVIEDCVNVVGVDLNIVLFVFLSYVLGLNKILVYNIVNFRDINGVFLDWKVLLKVECLGFKVFE